MRCGLLGERLVHSYSPQIHAQLGDYDYELFEREESEVERLLKDGGVDGLNVTIPYKQTVMPFLDELSENARGIGSVNTIVRRPDGTLFGDNTDIYGFKYLLKRTGIDVCGKKALVLGSGGTSKTARFALNELGAREVRVISRRGEDNYQNIFRHADADIVVNTTPVGMFPENGSAAVDLRVFNGLCGVVDVIYNPAKTALILQAERLGIPCTGGLPMLVAQAKRSAELFAGKDIADDEIERITRLLEGEMKNIVLIGMPGSGKTVVSELLGKRLNRPVIDADECVEKAAGMSIPDIFAKEGEEGFRRRETAALRDICRLSGRIIATGGGCVTREENYDIIRQNAVVVCLVRGLDKLAKDGRPLSLKTSAQEMYKVRAPLYRRFCDFEVSNDASVNETVDEIMRRIGL